MNFEHPMTCAPAGVMTRRGNGLSLCGAVCLVLCLFIPFRALAHDPGLSGLELTVQSNALAARLMLAPADAMVLHTVDSNYDGRIGTHELEAARWVLEELAMDALEIQMDGRVLDPVSVGIQFGENGDVEFVVGFSRPEGDRLHVRSMMLQSLPRGHRQFLVVREAERGVLAERMLDAVNDAAEVDLAAPEATPSRTVGDFLVLGIEHILIGYDHLLFLFGLLIVGGGFRSAVKIITAFTVAHSLTLALATLDWVRVPGAVVEPLIALSIVYVGVENLVRRDLDKRWVLTFVFGLVHGLGFASVLRDLGIGVAGGGAGLLAPLVGFNVGVELGQLAIAAVMLPLIWQGMKRPFFKARLVPAASLLVALAGGYWLVERIFF